MKLNQAQIDALAKGATPDVIASLADVAGVVVPPAPAGAPVVDASAAPAAGSATPTAPPAGDPVVDAAAAPAAAPAVAVPDNSAIVAHLTGQLADVNAALISAKVEAETHKAQAASVEGLVAALRTVVGEKLVALGGSAETAAGYTATNIAAEFARIDTVFRAQFKVGGVAGVAAPDAKTPAAAIDPMYAATLQTSLLR